MLKDLDTTQKKKRDIQTQTYSGMGGSCCSSGTAAAVSPDATYMGLIDRKYSDVATRVFEDLRAGTLKPRFLVEEERGGGGGLARKTATAVYALTSPIVFLPVDPKRAGGKRRIVRSGLTRQGSRAVATGFTRKNKITPAVIKFERQGGGGGGGAFAVGEHARVNEPGTPSTMGAAFARNKLPPIANCV